MNTLARVIVGVVIFLLVSAGLVWYGYGWGSTKWEKKYNDFIASSKTEVQTKIVTEYKIQEKVVEKAVEKIVYRDKFITNTKIQKEIEYVTKPLESCAISSAAVRLWNDSRACTLQPGAATCSVDRSLPASGTTP